ncbi:hypothetical protein OLV21_08735 [Campylobacter jejuni]|nr:hypothetical protein [Campylobacter jejuni]
MNNYIHLEELDLKANYADLEKELENLSKKECLRIEIDKGLENSLNELEDLMEKLPEQQTQTLFEQCTKKCNGCCDRAFWTSFNNLKCKRWWECNNTT